MGFDLWRDVFGISNGDGKSNGPDYAHGAQNGAVGHWNEDGSWTWDTGNFAGTTIPSNQAQGNKDMYDMSVADPAEAKKAQDSFSDKNGLNGSGKSGVVGTTDLSGATDHVLGRPGDVPGGSLDTDKADAQRGQTNALIAQLQQQAATGDGEWRQSFARAVQDAQSGASAVGQNEASQAHTGFAGSARNIGNAQGAIGQRAVGQEANLRTQAKNDAQNQLAQLLGQLGQGDIEQSTATASAKQGLRQANQALAEEGAKQTQSYLDSGAKAVGTVAALSDGGRVPGQPQTFGDDERNDTVPAWLSPGEIVVPRTKASDPDQAAAFARAVALRGGKGGQRLAGGGKAWKPGDDDPSNSGFNWMGLGTQAPTLENGAVLDTTQLDQTRGQMDSLAPMLADRAAGSNSVADTIAQTQADEATAAALAAQNSQHAVGANLLQALASKGSRTAAEAGAQRGNDQASGQRAMGSLAAQRRAQEIAFAQAQQKAAWNNTMMNAGVNLQNQASIRNMVSSAGQVAAGLAAMGGKSSGGGGGSEDPFTSPDTPDTPDTGYNAEGSGPPNESPPGDYPAPDLEAGSAAAHGGRIGFARAVRNHFDKGGDVSPDYLENPDNGIRVAMPQGETPRQESRAERKAIEHEEETGYAAPKKRESSAAHAQRKAGEHEEETGYAAPKKVAPKESAFARAVKYAQQFASSFAGGTDVPIPDYLAMPQRRDSGPQVSSIGYGAPAFSVAIPESQRLPPVPAPVARPSMTGAQLGLGGGFSPNAKVMGLAPVPQSAPPPSNFSKPENASREEIAKTLVQTGTAPDGTPIVESRDAIMQRPLPKGLRPVEDDAPKTSAPAKRSGPGVPAEKPVDTSSFDAESEAVRQQGAIKEQQARSEANALTAFHDELKKSQADQQQMMARAHEDSSALMARYNNALEEMKRVDTSIDPGRFWASRTTGQKVLSIIGMALATAGSRDGTNKAAELLGQAVDRDLEAQKVDVAARLRKGEGALAAAQNAYAMHRQLFQDDLAATAATKASLLELADNQTKQIAATYASPMAKQNAAQLSAQLQASKQKFIGQAQSQAVDNAYKRAETARAYAEAGKAAAAPGPGADKDALHTAQQVRERSQVIRDNLSKADSIINRVGTFELTGPDQSDLNNALSSIATDMAKLKDPQSAARPGEVEQEMKNLGFEAGSLTTSNATARELLRRYRKAVDQREQEALSVRGFAK